MSYRAITYSGLMLSVFLTACAQTTTKENNTLQSQTTAQAPQPVTTSQITTPTPSASFKQWVTEFRVYALANGISSQVFDKAFAGITPDPEVIKLDRSQPEFTRPVWEYLNGAVSDLRLKNGIKKIVEHQETLEQIESTYNVDHQVIIAIWGMESGYGHFTGNKKVIRSLATLAYEGRRSKFAKEQLIAALKILENGDIKASEMTGSWAGAMGQTQFIPTTYLALAVDFDGDGHRNIWTSVPDALASTANYLQRSGWNYKQTWGHEVKLPKHFDYAQTDIGTKKTVADWANLGVTLLNGQDLPPSEHKLNAAIILPTGANGPAFIVYPNFFAILKYNNSTSYALAVSLLADGFKGKSTKIKASWPVNDKPLSRTERTELQTLLNLHGYNAGHPDGIIGANTRQAMRAYQQSIGVAADGYPSHTLLNTLRNKAR